MTLIIYAVDLGTTNIKVVLYDESLRTLASTTAPMLYDRRDECVEFDPADVVQSVLEQVRRCAAEAGVDARHDAHIVITGQAESLVLTDAAGIPLAPGISWMDERSTEEAQEISARFGAGPSFAITGEPEAVATWPATKLRWIARHQPQLLASARHVLMIKDFVILSLTGRAVGEETTRGFTYLYDVANRSYWTDMIEFCGARPEQLPELVPAGASVGEVSPGVAAQLPPAESYSVNVGALDHFCAMVGMSSYRAGAVSASAGTVLALSMLAPDWQFDAEMNVSFHAGLRPGETVLFTCADSGGVSLDWFMRNVAQGQIAYDVLEERLGERNFRDAPLFLPYLTGLNPPDLNPAARGAFVDVLLRHDGVDMAFAVMEGVAHLLRRNLDALSEFGYPAESIVSAGGGTASAFWNQLKADVCALDVRVPDEQEATCRGAAVLALHSAGVIDSLDDTARLHSPSERVYRPRSDSNRARYDSFASALDRLYGPLTTHLEEKHQ